MEPSPIHGWSRNMKEVAEDINSDVLSDGNRLPRAYYHASGTMGATYDDEVSLQFNGWCITLMAGGMWLIDDTSGG